MTSEEQQDEQPKHRARTRRDPGRALMSAIERGDLRALSEQHLLDAVPATVDTRPATSGWTPLMMAAAAGEPEVVSALLDAGGDHGEALMIACALGRTAVSRLLIEDGADVSASDEAGRTALTFAAQRGSADTVRDLLEAGAEVDVCESGTGMTPLARAAVGGHGAAAAALLEAGAEVDAVDGRGFTPLLYAASAAQVDSCRTLLEAGADPNRQSSMGKSPLCAAITARAYFRKEGGACEVRPFDEGALLPVVDLLLRWGAEVLPDGAGADPVAMARALGYPSVGASLGEYGPEELRAAG